MRTAVWMVMWREPEMLAPLRGWAAPNSLIMDMRPGISTCASSISMRPASGRKRFVRLDEVIGVVRAGACGAMIA